METTEAFADFSKAVWTDLVRRRSGLVRLGSPPVELDLTFLACGNSTCTCEVVSLSFRERDADAGQAALAFDVQVDLKSDTAPTAVGLGAQAQTMAHGVAAGLEGASRKLLREALLEHRRRLACIPQTVAAYVGRGEMVPYAHVAAGGGDGDGSYATTMDEVDDGDALWVLHDHICGTPGCDCQNVRLAFTTQEGPQQRQFAAVVPLGKGAPSFNGLVGVSLAEAKAVYAIWQSETRFDRALLRGRYDVVRRLAAQGGATSHGARPTALPQVAASRSAPAPAPAGRREPCTCGSGKRYKNCCGRSRG